jgi:glutaredoxin
LEKTLLIEGGFFFNRILFTAAGCVRCTIAKKFMLERGLACEEHDIGGEGKDLFNRFYREHRSAVFRGRGGIEFPVFADAEIIKSA